MARDPLHTREQPILHTGGTADPQHKEGTRWTEPLAQGGHGGTLTKYPRNQSKAQDRRIRPITTYNRDVLKTTSKLFHQKYIYIHILLWLCDRTWVIASSFLRFLDHIRRTTVGRTRLRRVISSSQRPLPDNTQHSQQTNFHVLGGIRTHDLSRRAAADIRYVSTSKKQCRSR